MVGDGVTSSSSAAARKGRPLDRGKGAAILQAAQQLFMTGGFVATSMDAVAAAAGVAKLTVYKHFGSKHDLFARSVAARCEHVLGALDDAEFASLDLRSALVGFGRAFLSLILDPEAVAVHRLVTAERDRAPELGRLFFENAVDPTRRKLSALLDRHAGAGRLPADFDAVAGAQDLLALWRGRPFLLHELGVEALDDAALERHVAHGVDLCLSAWLLRRDAL